MATAPQDSPGEGLSPQLCTASPADILLTRHSDWGSIMCISNKFPAEFDAAVPGTLLREASRAALTDAEPLATRGYSNLN